MAWTRLASGFVLLAWCTVAAAQFKCTQGDGSVTFQQTPCANGQATEKLRLPPPSQAEQAAAERPMAIRQALAARRAAIGMTEHELLQAMGEPDKINLAQYGANSDNQLIYYRDGRTLYVYVRNGIVTSMQNVDGNPIRWREEVQQATRRPAKQCPTANQIRDIEVAISALPNRDNKPLQVELHRQLNEAKNCQP
jgi:hypothetical protein